VYWVNESGWSCARVCVCVCVCVCGSLCLINSVVYRQELGRVMSWKETKDEFQSFHFIKLKAILGSHFYPMCPLSGPFWILSPLLSSSVAFSILLLPLSVSHRLHAIFLCLSLYTLLLPNSLTSMRPLGLRTSVLPALAGPLMGRRAWKANMTGGRLGGLIQVHHWEGAGAEKNWLHDYKLTWVWSKCHPSSFHSSLHPYFFQMACTVDQCLLFFLGCVSWKSWIKLHKDLNSNAGGQQPIWAWFGEFTVRW